MNLPIVSADHRRQRVSVMQSRGAMILTFVLALGSFTFLSTVDDAAQAARVRETRGLTRGTILDRYGANLAWTERAGNGARRTYALSSLAQTAGYQDPMGKWHGVEKRYDSFLNALKARHDWRTFFLRLGGHSAEGGNVRLTLDPVVQRAADRALGAHKGAVVALDPRTGEVLSLLSKPYCSPRKLRVPSSFLACKQAVDKPLLNRATQILLPPGSAFKIVTLAAAIDTHRFTLDTIFRNADAWGPSPYFDNRAYPSNVTRTDLKQLTLAQALAFSDNFAFAHIGLTVGSTDMWKYAHRFYIARNIPFTVPVAKSIMANGHLSPSRSELAQSAFGAEVDRVTPLQMAMIASAVANSGVMMSPHLVQELETADGKVTWRYHIHALSRVMTPAAAASVARGMNFVVNHGSGYNAQIAGIEVAGKTGTAASGASLPNAWFIAFAPLKHPVVAVAVLREFAGEAFKYAAPVARQVLVAALQQHGYKVK